MKKESNLDEINRLEGWSATFWLGFIVGFFLGIFGYIILKGLFG